MTSMKKFILLLTLCLPFFYSCYSSKLAAQIEVNEKVSDPLILDFVFVFDPTVVNELQKVPASHWFAKRPQYKLDYENTDKIQILSYELIPGQKLSFKKFKPKQKSLSLIIYGSYQTKGEHRVIYNDFSALDVKLEKDDFFVKTID